ncbi:DUF892 family protein [Novosphingobium sp. JCM 18896]|uniref:DUF892 family protein n=1 Tax=Novosphingobium sp. JCM 18896 TaxID=2989731 RepID=UPI0022232C5A|nr:DUF892 family protein [Novosphingobium sp. JCM 18896]MCW1432219.1 DUF892 family protein [Novosphingobium sp. JCM 18896]
MTDVRDGRGLLILAIKDLADAEAAQVERLPRVREHARDPALVQFIERDESRSKDQRQALISIAREMSAEAEGVRNIWMRAILDDADNDAKTIITGPLLDIALAGALRKGKQSERVSYETAIALAKTLKMSSSAEALTAIRDAENQADEDLSVILTRLCGDLCSK